MTTEHEQTLLRKRKRAVLTLAKKMEIVRELQNGHSQRAIAEKYGVAKSTVGDIWKYRQKLDDCISSSESLVYAKKRCVVHEPKFNLVDSACWKWFCQQRAKGAPVSGVLLQEKARVFFPKLYPDCDPEAFKAAQGGYENSTFAMASRTQHCGVRSCRLIFLLLTLFVRSFKG